MNSEINISDEHYQVNRRFHVQVPELFNYLLKVVGVNYETEKQERQKLDLGKRRHKSLKTKLLFHLLRKMKKTLNNKFPKHETPKSF